jgi:hypothetical protein
MLGGAVGLSLGTELSSLERNGSEAHPEIAKLE